MCFHAENNNNNSVCMPIQRRYLIRSDTADKLQALFLQTPPDQKVANEIIRYKQAKGSKATNLAFMIIQRKSCT
jgi:hypothetical protein